MRKEDLVILIPFAGGSAYHFAPLEKEISKFSDVKVLEYPGRGRRFDEALLNDCAAIADDLYEVITPVLGNYRRYYIFGHSLGTQVGLLLIRKMAAAGIALPATFFVSGKGGPSKPIDRATYLLPPSEFREALKTLGGTPKEVLENDDFMQFFEPIMRADFQAAETFQYESHKKLNLPIVGLYGTADELVSDDMNLWQLETTEMIQLFEFAGNHFFLFDHVEQICAIIESVVTKSKYQGVNIAE